MTFTAGPVPEAEVVAEVARQAAEPRRLTLGGYYAVPTRDGVQQIDLTGDDYRDWPQRKSAHVSVRDVGSFAAYHGKHSDAGTEVFADLDAATVTAILDAHLARDQDAANPAGARWQEHAVTLAMRKTPAWEAWISGHSRSGGFMEQHEFAEFLEDHATDIDPAGPVSAADLIELAQDFHAHTNVQFSSGKRLKDGQTQFTYAETVDAGTERGTIVVPDEFWLRLRPLEDNDWMRLTARFRYRLRDKRLLLGYRLNDPATVFRNAVSEVVDAVEAACGDITILRGRPS